MTDESILTIVEQQALLQLAHDSINAYLETHKLPDYQPEHHSFLQPAAVFVTLFLNGHLRGCVGQILADKPLFAAVQDAALSAAFSDPRFPSLTMAELEHLQIKIAVLSPFSPIKPEEIQIGRHGLLIEHKFRRGLLLPEVASDRGWDTITFLQNLCFKANLPRDAWKNADKLLGFTTDVIELGQN